MSEEPVPIREGLERFFKHLGAPPVDVVSDLRVRWPEIVGPALAGPTEPVELVDGVLTVACDDPAWASQIGWMEAQIVEQFGRVFPGTDLRRISTRLTR